MNCSQTLPLAGMFFLLVSCGDLDGKPLDRFQEGDVWAKAGDIELTEASDKNAGSELYVRTHIHPRLKKMMGNHDGQIEQRFSNRFASSLHKSISSNKHGLKIYGGASPRENNGTNISITQNIGLNKNGEAYKLTITARQGKYFWKRSVERGPGYEHPKYPEPLPRYEDSGVFDPDEDIYGTMEGTRLSGLFHDRADIMNELVNEMSKIGVVEK